MAAVRPILNIMTIPCALREIDILQRFYINMSVGLKFPHNNKRETSSLYSKKKV
jgi:hypothetical protein